MNYPESNVLVKFVIVSGFDYWDFILNLFLLMVIFIDILNILLIFFSMQ